MREELQVNEYKQKQMEGQMAELDFAKEKMIQREESRESLLDVLEQKSRKLERELELNEQLASTAKREADAFR